MDTIFALASASGKAGVAVVRISGPDAHHAINKLTDQTSPSRGMVLRRLTDASGERLDDAVVLLFSRPASFTGEDVAELQLHGSVAVVASVLRELSGIEGLRLAEPGEFTRRALENGKLDLAQVEGLADLIESETEAQRKQAQAVFSGKLGALAEKWRSDLIRAAALIEATIDFADEDVPINVTPEVVSLIGSVSRDLIRESAGVVISERIRTGFEVAIIGEPNVGKSTLLNRLAGRDAALTSEFAGTTRDIVEVKMDLEGIPVTLLDTAGLRNTEDYVEGLGVALARNRANRADLRVFLAETCDGFDVEVMMDDILVSPKADLRTEKENAVSGKTGVGVSDLVARISGILKNRTSVAGLATRERHRVAMESANQSLSSATELLKNGPDSYELVAEELRMSVRALESLVGRVGVENLLDEIFSSFCLGK